MPQGQLETKEVVHYYRVEQFRVSCRLSAIPVGTGVCDVACGIYHSFNRFCCLFARLMIAACPGASNAGEVIATATRGGGKARGWGRIGNDGRGTEGCSAARGTFLHRWAFSFDILQPKIAFCDSVERSSSGRWSHWWKSFASRFCG